MARDSTIGIIPDHTASTTGKIFGQLLDRSAISLAPDTVSAFEVPADELHQEILIPLLPAMLGDSAIRAHWQEQKSTGFLARLHAHLSEGALRPQWTAEDFTIHVTASYPAGPDARALADTLLSEDSLRDLAAALMNKVLEAVWPEVTLPAHSPAPLAAPAQAEETVDWAEVPATAPAPPSRPERLPAAVFTTNLAEIARETSFVASVHRHFRPQPWNPRRNPVAGARNDLPGTFRNVLFSNPLETQTPQMFHRTL